MTSALRLAAGIPIIVGLSAAAWQAGRVVYADWLTRQGTVESLERVIAIAPENAHAHLSLALLLQDTDSAASKLHFEEAIRHNRWDSRSLVELALLAENAGDYPRAEKLLLEAARIDVLYFPRWSLANYYLRRGDQPNFWKWARSAARIPFGSLSSLYRLAAYVAGEDQSVVSLLNLANPDTLRDYLEFAMSAGRLEEVKEVSRKLSPEEDRNAILQACDILIRFGRTPEAVPICPSSGEFRNPPEDGGFEWRFPHVDGLETAFLNTPWAVRLRLYARQPQRCELLWRYLPVSGPGEVAISANLYTRSLPRDSGLHWELFDAVTGAQVGRQQDWLSAGNWTTARVPISVSQETRGLRLALVYERAPGTVRTEGELYLRDVRISGGRP